MTSPTEKFAKFTLILILLGIPLIIFGYQKVIRPNKSDLLEIEIIAAAPEEGGFTPDIIRIPAGETVLLRFSVPDVAHGIAIGPGLGIDIGNVLPGEVETIELRIDEPGRYTIYCNTWCSPNHWRMRSTIEVYDPNNPDALLIPVKNDSVIDKIIDLGIDIDAKHLSPSIPRMLPSSINGLEIFTNYNFNINFEDVNSDWKKWDSPYDKWLELLDFGLSEDDAWDTVSYLWTKDLTGAEKVLTENLYEKNCRVCHGQAGDGNGIANSIDYSFDEKGEPITPPSLNDLNSMLGVSNAVLYAKIRRGGMGTGMPGYGPIFTPEETWNLIDYIRTFTFGE